MDYSVLRRNMPCAQEVFGVPWCFDGTICLCLQSFNNLLKELPEDKRAEAIKITTEHNTDLQLGQGIDVYWRDHMICPSEEEYVHFVCRKTGGLFNMAMKLMQLFTEDKRDFRKLFDSIGSYYQIRNDYMNLTTTDVEQG